MARVRAPFAGPSLTSVGPITFGPNGVLLASDPSAATLYAINLGTPASGSRAGTSNVAGIDQKIAALLGTAAAEVRIVDMAVHPASKNTFVAVMRGQGPSAKPAIVRVDGAGAIDLVSLDSATFTSVALPSPAAVNPERPRRACAVGHGRGLLERPRLPLRSLERRVRVEAVLGGLSVHGGRQGHERRDLPRQPRPARNPVAGHGVRALTIANQPHIVAGYTCTPLVKFPVSSLTSGTEQGARHDDGRAGCGQSAARHHRYQKGGQQFLLMANSSRGVMKIDTAPFATPSTSAPGSMPRPVACRSRRSRR